MEGGSELTIGGFFAFLGFLSLCGGVGFACWKVYKFVDYVNDIKQELDYLKARTERLEKHLTEQEQECLSAKCLLGRDITVIEGHVSDLRKTMTNVAQRLNDALGRLRKVEDKNDKAAATVGGIPEARELWQDSESGRVVSDGGSSDDNGRV